MRGSETRRPEELERYLARLDSALAALPEDERRDILLETRSHVVEQTGRSPERTTAQVLGELGAPAEYAQRFLPETPARPAAPPTGVLHGIARLATGRWTMLPLLAVVLLGYFIVMLMLLFAIDKVMEPENVGLFVSERGGAMLLWSDPRHPGREVLGWWLIPITLGIASIVHLLMSAMLRRVLRNDQRR